MQRRLSKPSAQEVMDEKAAAAETAAAAGAENGPSRQILAEMATKPEMRVLSEAQALVIAAL